MKTIYILMCIGISISIVNAQKTFEKHFDFTGKESLELDIQIADSIRIMTWKNMEISASAVIDINNNQDNDSYIISFEESDKSLQITSRLKSEENRGKNHCYQSYVYWQIFIPENIGLTIETINGNLIITGPISEINARTISGFIDVSVSDRQKADLKFDTISGTVYSNHIFSSLNKASMVGTRINGELNGGGQPISLTTISGDIFFREMK